jgi:hypothetical protein
MRAAQTHAAEVLIGLAPIVRRTALLRDIAAASRPAPFVLAPGLGAPVCVMLVHAGAGIRSAAFRQRQSGCIAGQESRRSASLNSLARLAFGPDCDGMPLAGRTHRRRVVGRFGLIDPAGFSGHRRAPHRESALCNMVQTPQNNWRSTARIFDKLLIYVDVTPRYICDFDTRFALCALSGA